MSKLVMNKLERVIVDIMARKMDYVSKQDWENSDKWRNIERDSLVLKNCDIEKFVKKFRNDDDVYGIIKVLDVKYQRKLKIEKLYRHYII